METQTNDPRDTLFYDGQCPICSAEIKRLKNEADEHLGFVDITEADDLPLERDQLFSELHMLREDGQWVAGLEANVLAWQHTRWRWLAGVLLWPGIRFFAQAGYRLWLRWYQRQRANRLQQTQTQ